MRAVIAVVGLLSTLPACAPLRESGGYGRSSAAEGFYNQPLRARLVQSGNLAVRLNRPAYAAVFEIIPGRGVGLVYPTSGAADSYLTSGVTSLWTRTSNFYRSAYLDDPFGYSTDGPRYYYLIASDRPLRVGHFARSPMALRTTLGFQRFGSWNPYNLMDELANEVLPNVPDGNWDTDLYVVWPQGRSPRRQTTQLVAVRCNGRIFYVPFVYARQACANPSTRPDPVQRDSSSAELRTVPNRPRFTPRRPNTEAADRLSRQIERREITRSERPGNDATREIQRRQRPEADEVRRPDRDRTEDRRPERTERPQPRPEPRPEVQRPQPRSEPRPEARPEPRPAPKPDPSR